MTRTRFTRCLDILRLQGRRSTAADELARAGQETAYARPMLRFGTLPTVENLQCFLAAAEHLSFVRAASDCGLTPTAFGQRIRQLEEQLGGALFERTTRRVSLTESGLALLPHAREAVDQAARCLGAANDRAPALSFTVGSRFELAASWLAPGLAAFGRVRPTWKVHLYCGSGPDILERLDAGEVDAVVTSAPVSRSGTVATVLHPETYALVAAPSLLAERPFSCPQHARDHTLLDVDRSLPLTRYLTSAPGELLEFADERYLGSGAAMLALVRAGQGVAVLPSYMVRHDLTSGQLVALLPERTLLSDTFRLIRRRATPLGRALDTLAEFLGTRPLS